MKIKLSHFFLLLVLLSCTKTVRHWKGGSITSPGNYIHDNTLLIEVDIEDDLLKYTMKDDAGNEILRNKYNLSILHKWALYLDKDESLWVLSSDIGDGLWKRDSATNQYSYIGFDHYLTAREVPEDLYNDLKDYFD
jgi:hypothetical protein